jgi:hypothetical protein
MRRMECPLTEWESAVVRRLCSVDVPGLDTAREALDHLVVTGVCECGCGAFNLRDARRPAQPHEFHHVANGAFASIGFALYLGPDGRPIAVDVFLPDERSILEHGYPDPQAIEVSPVP